MNNLGVTVKKLWNPEQRSFVLAIVYTIFIYLWEDLRLRNAQAQSIFTSDSIRFGGLSMTTGLLSTMLAFLGFIFLVWFTLSIRWSGRLIFAGLLLGVYLIQYSYWNLFNRFMTYYDILSALSSPPELWNVTIKSYLSWWAFLPVGVYLGAAWLVGRQRLPGAWRLVLLSAVLIGVNLGIAQAGLRYNPGTSFPQFFRSLGQWAVNGSRQVEREPVPEFALPRPTNNIVVIVDESIRGDHLSLNGYERQTTPYLEELDQAGWVTNWGVIVSAGTCTVLSNPVILTGVPVQPEGRGQIENKTLNYPTLLHYARMRGYTTYYIDAQERFLWNGLKIEDLPIIDHWVNEDQLVEDRDIDFRAADMVVDVVTHSTGNFILLNKNGVHFLYEKNYPPEEKIWSPVPEGEDFYEGYPQLVKNSYDNGIRYNLEGFFRHLVPPGSDVLEHAVFLYTADHGQTLYETNVDWLHCGYTSPEARVPLFMLGKLPVKPDTAYKANHSNILPTVLDLMGVPDSARKYPYELSLFKAGAADSKDRYYLAGGMWMTNYDSGGILPPE